jgi:PAS domain S-box-containing protein
LGFDWNAFVAGYPGPLTAVRHDGTVAYANGHLARLLGREVDAMIDRPFADVVAPRARPPEGTSMIEHAQAEVARVRPRPLVVPMLHASGTELEMEWRVQPSLSAEGHPQMVLVLQQRPASIDYEVIPRAEVQEIQRIIFENVPVGILHFDERGVITACNDSFVAILGSSRQNLIGLDMLTLPDQEIVTVIRRALAGERALFDGEYTSVTGRKTTSVRLEAAPVRDAEGNVRGGVGLVQDVSEQRAAQLRVSRAERLASLGTLAAGVVHEVQNPLAYASTSLELALRTLDDEERRSLAPEASPTASAVFGALRDALLGAREGVLRVGGIVSDLKAFAKSDEALRVPVDVERALEAAIRIVGDALRARATLVRRYEAVPRVLASEPRLVQLFVNLLANAIEATPEGERDAVRVVVRTRRGEGGVVVVEIEDDGPGVPEADVARIFEPFWTSKPQGTGLGLAICHGIVAGLGGELTLARPRETRGACFVVGLPASSASAPSDRPPVSSRPRPPAERARILVVDDEERLAATLALALSERHDVDVAHRGQEALDRLATTPYELVLCDLLLPDLSGVDVFERATAAKPDLARRFVFVTGGAFTERSRNLLQAITNARIDKPFDLTELEQLLDRELAKLRAAR